MIPDPSMTQCPKCKSNHQVGARVMELARFYPATHWCNFCNQLFRVEAPAPKASTEGYEHCRIISEALGLRSKAPAPTTDSSQVSSKLVDELRAENAELKKDKERIRELLTPLLKMRSDIPPEEIESYIYSDNSGDIIEGAAAREGNYVADIAANVLRILDGAEGATE